MVSLFDEKTGLLRLDEVVFESKRFQKIMADEVVTDEEIMEQANFVMKLFREIEAKLAEKDKELVMETISELAVLYEINAYKRRK